MSKLNKAKEEETVNEDVDIELAEEVAKPELSKVDTSISEVKVPGDFWSNSLNRTIPSGIFKGTKKEVDLVTEDIKKAFK